VDDFEDGLDLAPKKLPEPPMPDLDEEEQAAYESSSRYDEIKRGEIHIAELQRMTMQQLLQQARLEQLTEYTGLKKQDLIFKILKERTKMNGLMFGEGRWRSCRTVSAS
jgi:transcription termination factor Rho